jgi:hypothetical protein
MKIKTTLAVIALMALPSLASAMCSDRAHVTAASCAEGYVWDDAKGACQPKPTS